MANFLQLDRHSTLLKSWAFLSYLLKQFTANRGGLNAAALTYTTLFAVVPMMTVTYAMLSSIPSFQGVGEQLEALVFDNFVPSTGATIRDYLSGFASQARSLTVVGVGFLMVTAFMMLRTIEAAFNRIWQVRHSRKGISSFLLYWAVLSLGPMLLGLGFVLTSYVASLPFITDATEVLGGRARLLSLLPLLTSSAAFTLIYAAVPNCPVPLRHALVGGIVVALLFEGAKRGFAFFVSAFPSYELIYGAFAAVPLFLAWIYISWLIILLGAELVHSQSAYREYSDQQDTRHLLWVLSLLREFWQAQRQGQSLNEEALLTYLDGLQVDDCNRYLSELQTKKVLARTEQGDLILARDLNCLTVEQLWKMMPWSLPDSLEGGGQPWHQALEQRLRVLDAQRNEQLNMDLASLFSINTCEVVERHSTLVEDRI